MLQQRNFKSWAIFLVILIKFANGEMSSKEQLKSQSKDTSDYTKDFTNGELNTALSDLSLKDLNTLQAFIDSSSNNDYNFRESSNSKPDLFSNIDSNHDYDDFQEYDHFEGDKLADNYNLEAANSFPDLVDFQGSQGKNSMKLTDENQRYKREDHQPKVDEEYIKQLDDSFPRNAKQTNNDDELKNDLVRVKRN